MTEDNPFDVEALWDRLLSRDLETIQQAFSALAPDEQASVLEHLQRMANEPGWHSEQRLSAQAALQAIHNPDRSGY